MSSQELSVEQQFALRSFESQVSHMSHEQAKQMLIELHKQFVIKEAYYKKLLQHEWGIGNAS